jgi:hypothetical protein
MAAAMTALFAAPVVAYAGYAAHATGHFSLSNAGGASLYGRVATFVDCDRVTLPPDETTLCPPEPVGRRHGPDYYTHDPRSPVFAVQDAGGRHGPDVVTDFCLRVLWQQPGDFARSVAHDATKLFSWQHTTDANPDAPTERWRFQTDFPTYPPFVSLDVVSAWNRDQGEGPPTVSRPVASFLRGYQLSVGYTPGPLLAVALLAALAAVAGLGRARRSPVRAAVLLYLSAAVLVLLPADAFQFTWRYQLPSLVLLPVAGALAVVAMARRTPLADGFPEPADDAALGAFRARYGDAGFAPVAVVVPAYNEAASLGRVLDAIPQTSCGQRVSTLVVVDGGDDDTAQVASAHGAYTCVVAVNRGQGAALRLGYHLARTRGARFIVTTDADDQYDLAQLPVLLEPLLAGEADLVTGSRRLGANESPDLVRRAGTRVFAWLVSVLAGQRLTDTSFGFRGMRAEVTAAVTLAQPQYQSAELLLGALRRGFRVTERPMTMRRRTAGRSKKGNNLAYGLRYLRAVLATWARERS